MVRIWGRCLTALPAILGLLPLGDCTEWREEEYGKQSMKTTGKCVGCSEGQINTHTIHTRGEWKGMGEGVARRKERRKEMRQARSPSQTSPRHP